MSPQARLRENEPLVVSERHRHHHHVVRYMKLNDVNLYQVRTIAARRA